MHFNNHGCNHKSTVRIYDQLTKSAHSTVHCLI